MLNRTGSIWDRNERIKINDNRDKLDKISEMFDVRFMLQNGLYIDSVNLINTSKVIADKYAHYAIGELRDNTNYSATDFMLINPNRFYRFEPLNQFAFYDENKQYISGGSQLSGVENPLLPPTNARYIRLSILKSDINMAMFYEGTEKKEYEAFKAPIKIATSADVNNRNQRIYNISQIYHEWKSGNKFPIAFLDDSQTDGTGTTGHSDNVIGTDHKPPKAYPTLLEDRFKQYTNNNSLRIYNAGFSGKTAKWANENYESIFGKNSSYSDVKMVFIGYGTNDRLQFNNPKDYHDSFRKELISLINKCFENGVQPVLMTEQPSISPGIRTTYTENYPLRTSGTINAVSNRVKKDLASEYNLELVDLTEELRKVVNGKESIPMTTIFNGTDKLHFGDDGHKLVCDVFTTLIYPYSLYMTNNEIIDLGSQYIENGVPEDKVTLSRVGKYSCYADYTVTADELMLKQAIYIDSFDKFTITCDTRTNSTAYMKLNGVNQSTNTVTVEPGYYLLEIMSGTTRAGFNGITIEKAQE